MRVVIYIIKSYVCNLLNLTKNIRKYKYNNKDIMKKFISFIPESWQQLT